MENQVKKSQQIDQGSNKKMSFKSIFENYGMLVIFAALLIICSVISPNFLKTSNILNIARQVSVIGIVSMGMTFVILTGGIDLSVGPTVACSALLVAGLKDFGPFVALLAALLFGLCAGLLNGTIITRFKVQPFIVTLGMMSILLGLGLTYSQGHPIIGTPEGLSFLGQGKLLGIPMQAVLFAIIAIICGIILKYTKLGRYTYAIGGNEEATKLSGISVTKYKTVIYGISGLLCGIAGVVMATHLNVGEASLGSGMEMDVIAAVVIGGTSLQGGKGNVFGTVIGVLIIGILSNLLNLLNVPGYSQSIFKGVIIVGTVLLQSLQERK